MSEATESVDDVVIVGGGIGGLASALALRLMGWQVRVLERAPEFAEVGAGVQLAPNATRLLRSWGLLDSLLETGISPKRLVMYDARTGRELTAMQLADEEFVERYHAPYIVLHRSDLLEVLLDGCRRLGVLLENDRVVTSVESNADGATIDVESGQRYRAWLVVGADGLHSTMRKHFVDKQPIYSGFVAYRSAVPIHQVSERANVEDVQLYIGPGIHLVQYPVRTGLMYNQVAVFRSDRFIAGEEDWGTPEELRDMFAGTCAHVSESIESIWTDQRWLMCDLEPLDSWVDGRLVLLGDAAHPMLQYLAQGACQAFEDAAALADCLSRHTADGPRDQEQLTKALTEYADLRRPRTAQVQRWARSWGEIWHTDGVGALLRDELFARRGSAEYRETDWLWGGQSPGQSPNGHGTD